MTKPKPKITPLMDQPQSRDSKPVTSTASSASQAPVLITAPPGLYAVLLEDGVNESLSPVIALKYERKKMIGFIAREDEIVPITEVELFERFYWGDPDDFEPAAGDADDDDDDADEDDDDDADEDDSEDADEDDDKD
jgi:hypothetical protein